MASRLLTEFKQEIKEFALVPAGGGLFELSVNGDLIYSKKKTGEFPDESWCLEEVGKFAGVPA